MYRNSRRLRLLELALPLSIALVALPIDIASAQDDAAAGASLELTSTEPPPAGAGSAHEEPNDTPMGAWISAGANAWVHDGGIGGVRLDMGIPIHQLSMGQLSLALPFVLAPDRFDFAGFEAKWFLIHIAPTLRWEWAPLERWGRLIVWAEGGGGVMIDRYTENGGGGVPPVDDTEIFGVIRFATGATFVFPFGLTLTWQPIGVMATVGHDLGQGFYETSFLVGYRFH